MLHVYVVGRSVVDFLGDNWTLSPSSITWYRPRGSDALRLGR